MNTDELDAALLGAERRVLKIQTKLHRWAREDPHCRLLDLVADPGFPLVAWARVRGKPHYVEAVAGVEVFLDPRCGRR